MSASWALAPMESADMWISATPFILMVGVVTMDCWTRYSKSGLFRFNGLPKSTFYLRLKACAFHFNSKNENPYLLILIIL